jgi:peptidoglycan/xylan/chitin deacetylase (PgdA/CDA1 family)
LKLYSTLRDLQPRVRLLSLVALLLVLGVGYAAGRWLPLDGDRASAAQLAAAPLGGLGVATLTPDASISAEEPVRPPRQKSFDLRPYAGRAVYAGPGDTKLIALTFDDGPSKNTEEVLRILREHDAHATFFFVGFRMKDQPQAVRDVVLQGCEVANHTWRHVSFVGMPEAEVRAEIASTQEEIFRLTGTTNQFVRPRSGKFDQTGMDVARGMGLTMVGWDAYTYDTFVSRTSVAEIEASAVRQTHGGSIVLLHEMYPETVKALPAILDRLQREGYRCVTLAELLAST